MVEEPGAAPERSFWRRHLVGIVAVTVLVLMGAWGASAWVLRPDAPDYTGRTVAAHFDFDCTNAIFWSDPASGYKWWAGDPAPVPTHFDTSPTTPSPTGPPPYHHASGRLHFETATHATFTSDAGGRLPMTRQPRSGVFYTTECSIDASDAQPPK